MSTNDQPRARVVERDGKIVLEDPDAMAVLRAVGKVNCKRFYEASRDRIAHFDQRAAARKETAASVVIVLLNVNDPIGGELADILMPGTDWQAMRDRGEVPVARGLARRPGVQDVVSYLDPEEGAKLAAMRELAVVVVTQGAVAVFTTHEAP